MIRDTYMAIYKLLIYYFIGFYFGMKLYRGTKSEFRSDKSDNKRNLHIMTAESFSMTTKYRMTKQGFFLQFNNFPLR